MTISSFNWDVLKSSEGCPLARDPPFYARPHGYKHPRSLFRLPRAFRKLGRQLSTSVRSIWVSFLHGGRPSRRTTKPGDFDSGAFSPELVRSQCRQGRIFPWAFSDSSAGDSAACSGDESAARGREGPCRLCSVEEQQDAVALYEKLIELFPPPRQRGYRGMGKGSSAVTRAVVEKCTKHGTGEESEDEVFVCVSDEEMSSGELETPWEFERRDEAGAAEMGRGEGDNSIPPWFATWAKPCWQKGLGGAAGGRKG